MLDIKAFLELPKQRCFGTFYMNPGGSQKTNKNKLLEKFIVPFSYVPFYLENFGGLVETPLAKESILFHFLHAISVQKLGQDSGINRDVINWISKFLLPQEYKIRHYLHNYCVLSKHYLSC
jgi:hypothetical protein